MKLLAVIPHYCHSISIGQVVAALRAEHIPVLIVDDASPFEHQARLETLREEVLDILYLPHNGGKGHAFKAGMRWAAAQGYSHILQIDADAQHHFPDIARFVSAAQDNPEALICGRPVYGADAPKSRLHGRKITNFWNCIHTASRQLHDGMCGFRLYPLAPALQVIERERIGDRMDFDNEILVHLYWLGLRFIWIDTPIRYAADGISHFRLWKDNLLISKMHNRLFWQMLRRRQLPRSCAHWAMQQERGYPFFLRLSAYLVRYLPTALLKPCVFFIVCYFYATSAQQRRNIRRYQAHLCREHPQLRLPKQAVFKQFMAFAEAICDRFAVWQGKIRYPDLCVHDPDHLYAEIDRPQKARGQLLICSHLGNIDICRALVGHHQGFKLNILVHTRHAQAFNQALNAIDDIDIQTLQVSELDAAAMLQLAQKIEDGEWIALAADRTPVRSDKSIAVDVLGKSAQMPQGAWLLAHLLQAASNTVFVLKQNGQYHLHLEKFLPPPVRERGKRQAQIAEAAQTYADRLSHYAALAPLQWFNFYDFWNEENPHG